jgi:drug/metabolite transporter (DMT)-like permease
MNRSLAGILFCVFALLAFALQDAIIKSLSAKYPVLMILTIRLALVLVLLLIIGITWHGPAILRATKPHRMLLRGILAFLAFSSYYVALSVIPMADAAAVFMSAPLFVTALSVVLLGEQVGLQRWSAIIIGFVAVLFMLNPGSGLFRIEAAIPMFSALCYAMVPIITRRIGLSAHALTIAIYTTTSYLLLCILAVAVIQMLPANLVVEGLWLSVVQPWHLPDRWDFGLMSLSGVIFTLALLFITQAYRIAAVSVVAPFEYSYLVWASLLGFIVFADTPGIRTVLGGMAVVGCGLYILYR